MAAGSTTQEHRHLAFRRELHPGCRSYAWPPSQPGGSVPVWSQARPPRNRHHHLSCSTLASERLARLVFRALQQGGVAESEEPRNLLTSDHLHVDGSIHEPWSRYQRLIWDRSIRDAYATRYDRMARNAFRWPLAEATFLTKSET